MKLKLNYFSKWLLVVLAMGLCNFAIAQKSISGTITDATSGEALIGANILVKGTSTGTVTDFDGNYSLNVPAGSDELEISYTGYATQTVVIGGRTNVNIELSAGELLDEVVVVGYGTQRKQDATGAIVALGEDDFQKGVISSPEQLLQGRAAGVQITQSSGEPGAGINIRIRGTSSVRGGNGPLFVVDGVPLSNDNTTSGGADVGAGSSSARNPLNFINPDDIENISVLKDASAAAIYGARGANGVVLITTKKGKAGQSNMSLSVSGSASTVQNRIDLVSAGDYPALATAAGASATTSDYGSSTDWQDEIFRTGFSKQYALSYGGGTESTNYRFSLGYLDQEGVVKGSSLERLSARINASHKLLNDRIELSVQATGARVNDVYAPITNNAGFEGDLVGAALQANPTLPVFNADGDPLQEFPGGGNFRNPVAMLQYIDDTGKTTSVLANFSGKWNITDALNYKITYGISNADGVRRTGTSPLLNFNDVLGIGRARIDNRYINTELIEHTLGFNTEVGTAGRIDAVLGFSYQEFNNRGDAVEARFFRRDDILIDDIDGVDRDNNPTAINGFSDNNTEELQSYFGRVNYVVSDALSLTATLRIDGSTKFGANNKYGTFPSFAAAYRINDDFKIRAGYGVTGNQEFPGRASRAIFNARDVLVSLPNPDLQWEESSQINVGLDYNFANGRFNGSLDYFTKSTTDLIFQTDVPEGQPAGAPRQFVNLPNGKVVNSGVELTLNAQIVNKATMSWEVAFVGSYLHNEVKDFDGFVNTGTINGQGLTGAYAQRIANGQPLFAFYMREFLGYNDAGQAIYANNSNLNFLGDPLPDVNIGIRNSFNFGKLDFSFFLQGVFGFQVYNNTANAIFLKGNLRNGRNLTNEIANSGESPLNFGEVSSRFLEKGDFVRLQNASLGYTFDMSNVSGISSFRVYLTGQNLLLFTEYSGFDPEVNTDKSLDGVPSLGIDYTAYPSARTFTLGANVGF